MSVRNDTYAIMHAAQTRGMSLDFVQANTLRRAQIALHRWAELSCGDGNAYSSWAIERDETTQIPYFVTYPHTGKPSRRRIADKETGALRRIAQICKDAGIHFYHQGDPRSCALYLSAEPITDNDYTRGIACVA